MPEPDPVLFEVHESHLNTGLRGYPVGSCRTSAVSAQEGVSYRGYSIAELSTLSSESVIHLLLRKEIPSSEDEAIAFSNELRRRAHVPDEVFRLLEKLPKQAHPMEWLIAGILYLGMVDKADDWQEDGLNLIARINTVAAAVFRLREGWGDPIAPHADLPYGPNFAHMLGAPNAHEQLGELLRLFHVLHMDHGGGNLSTFTGKAIASGHADVYVSIAGAMGALYGPLHGRANQECLRFVKEVGSDDPQRVESFVRAKLDSGGKIFGFGHAVLRAEDPRATVQYAFAEKHFADDPLVRAALALRSIAPRVLKENPKISNPYPNVDAISGALLNAAGLQEPAYYTALFGWSRVVGITAQIIDERVNLREGRGVPIYRPRFIAVDQPPRSL